MYPYVCASGGKKCLFGKFGVLCFLETPILRFTLLPYYWRIQSNSLNIRSNIWQQSLCLTHISCHQCLSTPLGNIRKPLVLQFSQRVSKEISDMKWVNNIVKGKLKTHLVGRVNCWTEFQEKKDFIIS